MAGAWAIHKGAVMPKQNSKFYCVFEANVKTKESRLILCSDYIQLQMFLDNLDDAKTKITIIEVDNVFALSELDGYEDLLEGEDNGESSTDYPQCYLN